MQLHEILNTYRQAARTEREKGDYFERLVRVFLENDDTQKQFIFQGCALCRLGCGSGLEQRRHWH